MPEDNKEVNCFLSESEAQEGCKPCKEPKKVVVFAKQGVWKEKKPKPNKKNKTIPNSYIVGNGHESVFNYVTKINKCEATKNKDKYMWMNHGFMPGVGPQIITISPTPPQGFEIP